MKLSTLFALFLVLYSSVFSPVVFAVSSVDFDLKGVSGDIEDNVNSYLSTISIPKGNNYSYFESKVRKNIIESIQVYGFYAPKIAINLTLDDDDLLVFVDIKLGQRVKLANVNIQVNGDASADPMFLKLLNTMPLTSGGNLSHQNYDKFKADITKLALARGYFDGKWQKSEVRVSIKKNLADIDLIFDSKQRYVFGESVLSNQTKSASIVSELATFKVGQEFESHLVAEYSLALFNSRYFQSASVAPDLNSRKDGQVPIIITVINHPSNTYEVGVGYLSDVGVRGSLGWKKPWINSRGDSISADVEYSTVQQEFTLNYNIPIEDPITNIAKVQFGFQRKDNKDTKSKLFTFQLQRQFELESKWLRTWFVKVEQEDFTQASQTDSSIMILPGVSFARTKQRGGVDPYWGNQQLFSFEVASPIWGADTEMIKVQSRTKYLRSINRTHFFTSRVDLGAIYVDEIESVPASMRFFAGGSQSIRGYDYETVTPVDDADAYIGGRYLTVGSLEYGYQFAEKWRIGFFADAGTSTNDFSEPMSLGIGTGIRWMTPIGPVKLDFAVPMNTVTDTKYTFHLYIGPEL
ncbi:autotransporter assembly complex family protein [Moritella sp. Urea-trap-13]|uniref:autotransporter assembly complex protein TamA n=1 Tax=Moritella sp. Urea-trap-13 TaxID=2058327 RepID=UPI000C344EF6|nr:autotransporter assembly complex family protein [Moritella sp. Urea-trap-13]PKH06531.1 outer membrane protein assembly factor [Moritella sp. Urea-trap-13]